MTTPVPLETRGGWKDGRGRWLKTAEADEEERVWDAGTLDER